MKVLAVLGENDGIDIETDRQYLDDLLGKETIEWLDKPSAQELSDRLWDNTWDIFFFAGHSSSQNDTGKIYLRSGESLTVNELKFALKKALNNGLKLAIFNSCDGLGLARDLAELKIPHTIVMREPIPDEVAQKFLRYFLELFSQRTPLYKAVKQAREKLQGLEKQLPCASWLPIVYETPGSIPIVWRSHFPSKKLSKAKLTLGISLGIIGIAVGIYIWLDRQNTIDSRISEGEKVLIKTNTNLDKEEGVKAFVAKDCQMAKDLFFFSLEKNRNDPESSIYFNNSDTCDRPYIKLGISVPIGSNPDVAQEILQGVAQAQNEINQAGGIKGKLIKFIIANDDNNEALSTNIADRFSRDPSIQAVIAHNASDASVAACPVYEKNKLVMITPTSFSNNLSTCGNYIFRSVPNIHFMAKKLADYIVKDRQQSRIAICVDRQSIDNESFTTSLQSILNDEDRQNRVTISKVDCNFGSNYFDAEKSIAAAKKDRVDAIVLAPHVDRIYRALEVVKASQGRFLLYGSPTLYTNKTLQNPELKLDGMAISVPWHPTAISGNKFAGKAEKLWGVKVTWRTAYAYDSVIVIAQALAISNTRDELQKTLSNPDFYADSATGKIEFLPSGDRNGKAYIVKVQKKATGKGYEFVPFPTPTNLPAKRNN
jgi:branched-chain amino acid transport system substrate-binding protein